MQSPLIIILFITVILLSAALIILGRLISPNSPSIEKASPYECGFAPINSSRLPFSFRFFLIAILFLIFDLEIALLLVFPFTLALINPINSLVYNTLFLTILGIGLFYEWTQGGLEWAEN
uniref:NADH-ubiquinone oxidoreductase chain 3 n=1 Tax=Amphiura sp. JN-2020 TaxID=2763518 RepID=A0A7H0R1L5_9ECHI|nr:NADH dehydrogenase subunit 3 [Amphiura sp. JN-2020]